MPTSSQLLATAVMALSISLVPAAARAASTVYGDGLAKVCYQLAKGGRADTPALRVCDAAVAAGDPDLHDRAATVVNRGIIHLRRHEAAAALADFDRAIAWLPELADAHVNRGAALILSADYAGAIVAINRGLDLGAEDPQDAYFNRAVANEKLDHIPDAYRYNKKALELAPDWALPRSELTRFTVRERR